MPGSANPALRGARPTRLDRRRTGRGSGTGVIGFAPIAELPANTSRFIVMTTRCNNCPGLPSHSAETIRTATAHEWGHMLGVWNHSFDPADLLYPLHVGQSGPSNRDLHTMVQAYSHAAHLNLSALPPNMFSEPDGDEAAATAAAGIMLRYLHRHGEEPTTTLEFNPPEP